MAQDNWSIEQSRLVYGLGRKDLHFLDVTQDGELCVCIRDQSITFSEIIRRIRAKNSHIPGYTSSFTLRLPQLISYQIEKLKAAFAKAKEELGYAGEFVPVYPVKVNQRRDCVVTVLKSDSNYGLEAGTKAELLLIKGVIAKEKHRLIICNGAKDPEYLEIILQCIDEGYNIAISIESFHEAGMIVKQFKPANTKLVLRIKPYLKVEGHWSHSTGRDSKFGLSIHDMRDVVRLLKKTGFEDSVIAILSHAGSQITDIDGFRRFGRFMTRIFTGLREMGLDKLEIIDLGGGLPIDYTSSHPADFVYQYSRLLVEGIQSELDALSWKGLLPKIMVESGRGVTALSSLIVVKVFEVRSVFPPPGKEASEAIKTDRSEWLERIRESRTIEGLVKVWNQFHATYARESGGILDIFERERLVGELESAVRSHIISRLLPEGASLDDLGSIERSLWHPEHIVVGNFSIFNAAADHVLVRQHFPVIPIRDLHVRPETTVRLVDITCDSDGEISDFYKQRTDTLWFTRDNRPLTSTTPGIGKGIPIGELENLAESWLVIALTGAYQDVIEMDHNLLGDLPDVELILTENNEWRLVLLTPAQSIEDLLRDAGYAPADIDEDPYMSSG